MSEAATVIDIRCQCEQREILAIKIVLQIERARKSSAGDLFFVPRAVRFLRTQQKAQAALNARSIQLAACADTHHRPCSLRSSTLADAFGPGIVVGCTGLAPAAIAVLTPLLCHRRNLHPIDRTRNRRPPGSR